MLDFDIDKPIYIQLAELIEDSILSGAFEEEKQIPSTTEISLNYKVNPATALKGMNILVDEGIIYKKRGVGMFVSTGAVVKLKEKHKADFLNSYVESLIAEAKKLSISQQEIISMIEKGFSK